MKNQNSIHLYNEEDKRLKTETCKTDEIMIELKKFDFSSDNYPIIPSIGTFNQCISIIKKETKIPQFFKYIKIIDNEFGVSQFATTEELMTSVVSKNNKKLTVLSGYAHLLLAEQMKKQDYDLVDINKEISKAEALLDFANLGGNSPLLPRAMKLKRRVNWKSFIDLVISCIIILLIIILIGLIYKFITSNDIDIF
ncbi:hypothetical protein M9Y10_035166 [Tritrichomonas musculus]|uniref:Uncharacterized protein n=1 Tax=Tritrichomonas musculus TaxID=1915356 RepID=A0ABR2KK70_9EUKA